MGNSTLMTLEQFAKAAGVCVATVWRWKRAGLITGRKVGHKRYYTEQELHLFNARHSAPANGLLLDRAIHALELIAAAQVAQALALAKFGAPAGFDAEGFRCSAAGLLQQLGITPSQTQSDTERDG